MSALQKFAPGTPMAIPFFGFKSLDLKMSLFASAPAIFGEQKAPSGFAGRGQES
jgi:hypothetical protein